MGSCGKSKCFGGDEFGVGHIEGPPFADAVGRRSWSSGELG